MSATSCILYSIFYTSIHGLSFVWGRYCSVKIGLWTRHVQSLLRGPGYAVALAAENV